KIFSCNGGSSYTPNLLDTRQLSVSFDDHSGLGIQTLPVMEINHVPFAVNAHDAQNIGGVPAASVLRLESGNATPLNVTDFGELLNLINGSSSQYEKVGRLNNAALPPLGDGQVLGWNSGAWVPVTP